jgi:PadR family transcriptional regulator PadR
VLFSYVSPFTPFPANTVNQLHDLFFHISDSISEGTIYPLLRRFRNEGYVDTYLEESQSGPPRKYYKLTASGQAALVKQEEEWHAFVRGVNTILEGATHEEN